MADPETPKKGGAATVSAEDHVKFLISCIKFANAGKIDWAAVSEECNIVSRAAAAKRYERLLKAHGASPKAVRESQLSASAKGKGEETPSKADKTAKTKAKEPSESDKDAPTTPTATKKSTKAATSVAAKRRKANDGGAVPVNADPEVKAEPEVKAADDDGEEDHDA